MPKNRTANIKKGDDYRHGDLVNACVEVGLRLIKEQGVEKLSLRAIAREIGVSMGAPYKHFDSKEALLAAIAKRGFDTFEAYLTAASPEGIHFMTRERFTTMGYQYLRFAQENPEYYRLMFTNVIPNHRDYPELWASSKRTFRLLIQAIEVLQREGTVRAGSAVELATHTWAMLNGFVFLHLEQRLSQVEAEPRPIEELFRPHFELMFTGLEVKG